MYQKHGVTHDGLVSVKNTNLTISRHHSSDLIVLRNVKTIADQKLFTTRIASQLVFRNWRRDIIALQSPFFVLIRVTRYHLGTFQHPYCHKNVIGISLSNIYANPTFVRIPLQIYKFRITTKMSAHRINYKSKINILEASFMGYSRP